MNATLPLAALSGSTVTPIKRADEAVSDVMAAFQRRSALEDERPLAAFAFRVLAGSRGQADCHIWPDSLLATYEAEAERALRNAGADLALIDKLYPKR